MDPSIYENLTGTDLSTVNEAQVSATITRTQSMLETMLGFTLDTDQPTQNLYNELGKSQRECACPSVDAEDLDDPDEVQGAYRLFDYNDLDQYIWIDPVITLYKVKLVYIKPGEDDTGVTLKTFSNDEIRIHQSRGTLKKYLERCLNCFCSCECTNCVQLAIDADWAFTEIPQDLQLVWTDMVAWYSDPKTRMKIKSETIDTHSYTKFDNTPPEMEPYNLSVIQKYAGPHGSATVIPTTGQSARGTHRRR